MGVDEPAGERLRHGGRHGSGGDGRTTRGHPLQPLAA
jgi:hypothetical protein